MCIRDRSGRPDPHISIHLKFVYIFINILQLLLIGVTDLFVDISTEPVSYTHLGFFDYEIYAAANYIELGVSVLLFLFIFLFFLQRKIRYVHQLEEEVKILEGGGMDKQITEMCIRDRAMRFSTI